MARIINFQGRTIQVPDGASDEQVRQILQAPATDTPKQSAAYEESLARSSAASQTLNTSKPEAPAQPSFMDNVMGALGYAGGTAAIAGDRFGEGMANLAGLPVDVANLATELGMRGADAIIPGDQSWMKASPNPIGGSENLNDARKLFGVTGYEAPQPQDPFQKVVGRVSEELGASALPVVGLTAKGAQMGARAARESGNALVRNFVAPAAANPARFVGAETVGATAAGTGAGIANLFVDRSTPGGQAADMVGALGGAGVAGIGGAVGRGIGSVFNAVRQNPNYVDQIVKDAVVDRIGKAGGLDNGTDPMDTEALIEAITRGDTRRPSDIIPGFQESLADTTQNPGIAALEYSRQSGPNAGEFVKRRGTNNQAVDQVMEAVAPQQTPGAFRSELETQRDLRLSAASEGTQNAQSEFDQYIQNLQPTMGAEERGATIREGLTNANRAARETESTAWQGIDGQVDPNPLADTLDATRQNLTLARQQATADLNPTADIPRQLSGTADAPVTEAKLGEILDMRSKLLDDKRAAMSGQQPDRNKASVANSLLDNIEAFLSSDAIDPALRAQIDDARGVSRGVNEQFNRPNDPIAQTLARSEGRPDLPDSAVGPRFVQPDSKQASNIDRLLAATDLTSQGGSVREAVKNEILGGIEKRNALTDPARLETYLNQFGKAFDRYPDLRDEVSQAITSGRTRDAAGAAETALTKNLGSADGTVPGKGPVGKYLQFSDANSERAINEVLNAKDPGAAADELLNFIGDKPSAVEGARAAFWQKLRSEAQSTDNAQRSMGGSRAWRGDWLKSFMDKPTTRAVAERLYRDNPEHLDNIRSIADVLDNVDLRQRGKAVGASGTAQGTNPILSVETLQSRFYAYTRGQVSGTYLATSIAAVLARRAVRRAQTSAIETMTDKALLNPEFAAQLLKDNNPANRAALAKKVRTWMGNEASTLINLLDAPEDGEPRADDTFKPPRIVVQADERNYGNDLMDAVTR